jgi:hypothetical protein
MSSSNTQINLISSSIIKILKNRFIYDDSFDTIISLLIITSITNLYTILTYINEDNIKKIFNDEEFINNLRYFIKIILVPCIKCMFFISVLYYIKKNRYHIIIYNYIWNYFYKIKHNSCKHLEINKCKDEIISYNIDISNLADQIDTVYKFIELHPNFFKRNTSYKIINHISDKGARLYPIFEGNIEFKDPIHNVYGYLKTRYKGLKNNKNETIYSYDLNLYINKDINDNKCYIKQLETYINRINKKK